MNRICLVGKLTRDAEAGFTPSGNPVAHFTLAVPKRKKETKSVEFFPVTCWSSAAEFIARHGQKGCLVSLEGRMESRVVALEGAEREVWQVIADTVSLIDTKALQ